MKGFPDQMNSYQGLITEKQIDAIIAYMMTLSDKAPKDGGAPAAPAGDAPAASPQAAPPASQH